MLATDAVNRTEFQQLSRVRQREARVLLKAGQTLGAYYLAGYAVECALKACIAKQTRRHDFPNRERTKSAYTHDLERLVRAAGLERDFARARSSNAALEVNWALVKDWNETSRYKSSIGMPDAKDLLSACVARKSGILSWIRARW